ncbi:ABC transporter substrate-binding protein [Microbacterium nymphoidis]|uniref:ABC transporter substrate-binding protein n=1 Tax=Microbacterium nymphoidis TaxID=2898586 RepID=UPI001E640FDA|nr:ABC transporter substrate-binding protein [Microbacterium nymphoidis]MCD2498472.1 ABC transporter substrate-binding protein [Microbacterium nymphoidis]
MHARTIRLASAASLGVLLLAGCAPAGANDASSEGTLTYWSMWTEGEPQAKVIQTAIDDFEDKTGVTVDVEWQGRKVLDQVTAGLAAGTAPDLVDQSFDRLGPALNSQNALLSLDSVWAAKNADGDTVSDAVDQTYVENLPTFGGDAADYLFPYTVSTISLFYNGASPYVSAPPATYQDILDSCAAAKADGVGCIVSDADAIWAAEYWFDYLYNRNSNDASFADLTSDESGKLWDDAAAQKTAEQIAELISLGYMVPSYDASQYPAGGNNWAQGQGDPSSLLSPSCPSGRRLWMPGNWRRHTPNWR